MSNAGSTSATIRNDSVVPRPRSVPSSVMMLFVDVAARVKPAVDRMAAEMKTASRLPEKVYRIASFFKSVSRFLKNWSVMRMA
jgi:hypothetical protein